MFLINSIIREEYYALFIYLILALSITFIIIFSSYFLVKQNPEAEKLSAYECGFEPYENSQHSFDIKFCVVAILFVIFDVEIMFLIPWSIYLSHLNLLSFWSMMEFLFELGIGFFYAWYTNALDWD
jgi:NADH:ubiquinone oxidoreductase subunit 3 (subunit A)